MGTRLARLVAAVVLTAAAGVPVLASAPAQAAACSGSTGVTVVVDFNQLGGGIQQQCSGDGGSAASMFEATGFPLTRLQSQPGFICRVSGVPADDPCVDPDGDAYWSLWWNNGKGGSWTYATFGADGLKVPSGGSVAFSWNAGGGRVPPGTAPVARLASTPAATQTTAPSTASTGPGSQQGGSPAKATSGTTATKPTRAPSKGSTKAATKAATPTASAASSTAATTAPGSTSPSADASATPATSAPTSVGPASPDASTSAAAVPTDAAPTPGAPSTTGDTTSDTVATSSPTSTEDGGLPPWVAPVLVLLLFGAAGAMAVVRRRGARTP